MLDKTEYATVTKEDTPLNVCNWIIVAMGINLVISIVSVAILIGQAWQ